MRLSTVNGLTLPRKSLEKINDHPPINPIPLVTDRRFPPCGAMHVSGDAGAVVSEGGLPERGGMGDGEGDEEEDGEK